MPAYAPTRGATANYPPPAFPVAFARITRPSASQLAVRILHPIPLAIPNKRVSPATQANRVPNKSVFR